MFRDFLRVTSCPSWLMIYLVHNHQGHKVTRRKPSICAKEANERVIPPSLAKPFQVASGIRLSGPSSSAHLSPTKPSRFLAKRSATTCRSRDALAKPVLPSLTAAAVARAHVPQSTQIYGTPTRMVPFYPRPVIDPLQRQVNVLVGL